MKGFIYVLLTAVLILAAAGCASLQKSRDEARIAYNCANIRNLKAAAEMYYIDLVKYPATLQDLLKNPGENGWKGPYISGEAVMKDAWETPLRYELHDGIPKIASAGPDMIFGTEDDMSC